MKTHFLLHLGMVYLLLLPAVSLYSQGKTITIGRTQNQTGLITDLGGALQVLKANLSGSAVVSDLRVDYAYAERIFYLSGQVSNDSINAIFISLHEAAGQLFAMAGPGTKIACSGSDCEDCREMCDGRPCCQCRSGSGKCDMVSMPGINL